MFNVSVSVHMPNPDVAAAMESNVAVRIAIICFKFFIFCHFNTPYIDAIRECFVAAGPLFQHLSDDSGQLVSARCAATMTIYAIKNFHGFLCGHAFKKAAYSLQVTVASSQILDIVQIAILEVKINLLGTNHCARHGSYMTDSIFLTVRHDSVIFSYVFHIYVLFNFFSSGRIP